MNKPFKVGDRVRNYGEQWLEAQEHGTATVLEVKPQPDGTFEYRVLRDKPLAEGMSRETWWASYSTMKPYRPIS